jgi:hypothetical protein
MKFRVVFFTYLILGTLYFSFVWGYIIIDDLLHPRIDRGMAFAWNLLFLMLDTVYFVSSVVITFMVDAFMKRKTDEITLFSSVRKKLPSFKTIFSITWKVILIGWILFQPYLIWSGYKAYNEAKRLDVKNFSRMGIFHFYSPFIKHIRVDLKNVEDKPYTDTYKRWSYRRGRFVYEYR